MIVILCKSFKSACQAFQLFLEFLVDNEPWSIRNRFESVNCIETNDDLRYIFIDSRCAGVFEPITVDILTVQEFFEGINDFYYYDEVMEYYDL